MIEIIREEEWEHAQEKTLPKDIRQIGKPDIGDRIYVEDRTYHFLHPYESVKEKTAYVLLGRFENYSGRQCTFVEAAIRLEEISFEGELPVWNDNTWAYIYKQLKREYDSMVIVGWAMDIKGQQANMTERIEMLHQNNFGGVHQVLCLIDNLEGEEAFFGNRNGRLCRREGFYIYYDKKIRTYHQPTEKVRESPEEKMVVEEDIAWEKLAEARVAQKNETLTANNETFDMPKKRKDEHDYKEEYVGRLEKEKFGVRGGNYRKQVLMQEDRHGGHAYVSSIALLAVICILGVAAYTNHQKMMEMEEALAQMNNGIALGTEQSEQGGVPVEKVEGNVTKQEETESENKETESSVESEQSSGKTETNQTGADGGSVGQTGAEDGAEKQEVAENTTEPAMTEAQTHLANGYYMVQKGDTLVSICKKIYQTEAIMDKLCEANDIEDQDSIYAGQKLILPSGV